MSNQHITAAIRCSSFKGTARHLLLVLADAASPGPDKKDKDAKKILPFGYCKRRLQTLMASLNIRRQPTVTAAIRQLKQAGAIKQWLKKGASPLYFVDFDWLKQHEFTDSQLDEFEYEALKVSRKANNLTSGLPAGSPPLQEPYGDDKQRKPFNLGNGNRLTSNTESVYERNGKRLTPSHLVPPAEAGILPTAAECGFFPPAEQGQSTSKQEQCFADTFGETQGRPLDPQPGSPEESISPCSPEQQQPPIPRPPAPELKSDLRAHKFPKGTNADDLCEVCGCERADAKFFRVPCEAVSLV